MIGFPVEKAVPSCLPALKIRDAETLLVTSPVLFRPNARPVSHFAALWRTTTQTAQMKPRQCS